MNIRILLLISFILEIVAETGLGFNKVIFIGLSLKNLLLLLLVVAVFSTGSKNNILERRKRFIYSKGIHRNYLMYLGVVIIATALAYAFIDFTQYNLTGVIIAIKNTILYPYLVFLIFLLYPKDKQEFEKLFGMIMLIIVVLAGLTIAASIISPGMFFGLDGDSWRPNGPFGEPNMTAVVLSLVLLQVIAPLVGSGQFSYIRLIAVMILFGCILITGSRGGLLAAVLGVGYFLFSMRMYMGVGKKITTIVSIVFGIIIVWLILPDNLRELIVARLGIFDTPHIDWREASSGRSYLWRTAIEKWLASPIFGYGWMGFTTMIGAPTHNSYLEVLVSSGPLGLLFYGLVVKNILVLFSRTDKLRSVADVVIVKGFMSGSIALFIALFFVNLYIPWLVVWAIIGLMVGYRYSLEEKDIVKETPTTNKATTEKRILSLKRS